MKVTHTCTSMYMMTDFKDWWITVHIESGMWDAGFDDKHYTIMMYITTDQLFLHCANDNFSISFISLIFMVKLQRHLTVTDNILANIDIIKHSIWVTCTQIPCFHFWSGWREQSILEILRPAIKTLLVCESAFLGQMIRGLLFLLCMSVVNLNLPYNFLTAKETDFSFTTIAIAWSTIKWRTFKWQ